MDIDVLCAEAIALERSGELEQAKQKYQQVLAFDRDRAEAWHGLGTIDYQQGRYDDALDLIDESLALDSSKANYHYSLGLVLAKLGYFADAIEAYERAIALDSDYIEAYDRLGNTLVEAGDLTRAESIYQQAIALQPHSSTYLNLSNLFLGQQRIDEAIAACKTALQLKPRDPDIIYNLGLAFAAKNQPVEADLYFGFSAYRRKRYEEAIGHYNRFRATETGDIDFYLALADCYQCLNRSEDAIAVYREGIRLYPEAPELYLSFMLALQNFGQIETARQVADLALELLPNNLLIELEKLRLFPILYDNVDKIDFYRNRFTQELNRFVEQIRLDSAESKEQALRAIGVNTNFYLQYQGKNDLKLQQKYGNFVHQVMAANYPQWVKPLPMPPLNAESKIKIGYISACLQWHTVGMVFLGWLRHCDRQQFEVSCYDIGRQQDKFNQLFQLYSDRFYSISDNLEAVSEQILSERLHILVFLDIGMYPLMTQLGGLRLAPVQCVAWGHPITSGLPTLDYFISVDLMEPENAQTHYSEKLIRLPNIGISYPQPLIPEPHKSRGDFGLRDDAVVYLSCQSLFKYLPQYDILFAAIAQQVPKAQFAFVTHKSPEITEQFSQRLEHAFAKIGLKSHDYCHVLPRQNKLDYWNLISVSDIFLDTFGFTGFLTTLEAVAGNLPIVTCAGQFMRGRQSAGILTRLGVAETIATNESDYIKIAVKLGLDGAWRTAIQEKIRQHHTTLYDDASCVAAIEAFYHRVVRERKKAV